MGELGWATQEEILDDRFREEYFVLTFGRNPWTRMLSAFNYFNDRDLEECNQFLRRRVPLCAIVRPQGTVFGIKIAAWCYVQLTVIANLLIEHSVLYISPNCATGMSLCPEILHFQLLGEKNIDLFGAAFGSCNRTEASRSLYLCVFLSVFRVVALSHTCF